MVTFATMFFGLVKVMVFTGAPQLKVIVPPLLLAMDRAVSNADSVQEAGVPFPTTALAACAVRTPRAAVKSVRTKTNDKIFLFILCSLRRSLLYKKSGIFFQNGVCL
jgi:hypothetical protein